MSVQTTERYLGCKQRIQSAVNDRIGIEPQLCAGAQNDGRVADKPRSDIHITLAAAARFGAADLRSEGRSAFRTRTSLPLENT